MFAATADTLYAHVPVTRIAKGKISFFVHFNTVINYLLSQKFKRMSEIFKPTGISIFYT
jgi:hypothetical protein